MWWRYVATAFDCLFWIALILYDITCQMRTRSLARSLSILHTQIPSTYRMLTSACCILYKSWGYTWLWVNLCDFMQHNRFSTDIHINVHVSVRSALFKQMAATIKCFISSFNARLIYKCCLQLLTRKWIDISSNSECTYKHEWKMKRKTNQWNNNCNALFYLWTSGGWKRIVLTIKWQSSSYINLKAFFSDLSFFMIFVWYFFYLNLFFCCSDDGRQFYFPQ